MQLISTLCLHPELQTKISSSVTISNGSCWRCLRMYYGCVGHLLAFHNYFLLFSLFCAFFQLKCPWIIPPKRRMAACPLVQHWNICIFLVHCSFASNLNLFYETRNLEFCWFPADGTIRLRQYPCMHTPRCEIKQFSLSPEDFCYDRNQQDLIMEIMSSLIQWKAQKTRENSYYYGI